MQALDSHRASFYRPGMTTDFNDYLTRCVGLSAGTAYNYSSAVNCIRGLAAPKDTPDPEQAPWPKQVPQEVWDYMHSRGRSWRRTIDAAWKHYRDYCGVEDLPVPPTLEGPAADEMPEEVIHGVRRLIAALGIQAVQRLRWVHVDQGRLLDHQGSPLPRSRSIPSAQLLEILAILHEWGQPAEVGSPVVPDVPSSLMAASRRRLREIEKRSRDLKSPPVPPPAPVVCAPRTEGIRAQVLAGGFAAPSAEAIAAANLPSLEQLPAAVNQGSATGRPVQSREKVEETLRAKAVPAHMALGVQSEITGSYPDNDDDWGSPDDE